MEGVNAVQISVAAPAPAVPAPAVAVQVPAVAAPALAPTVPIPAVAVQAPAPAVATPAPAVADPAPATEGVVPLNAEGKKKRGRPRKYGAEGNLASGSYKKKQIVELESSQSDKVSFSVGANFVPHLVTVDAGQDISRKMMSLSKEQSRAICVISGSGTISTATLHQTNSSGGTLTYEGRFQIISLSGFFIPNDNGGMKTIVGGLSVSLAGPDGLVMGGELAGVLIAATPVQVVIGSFLDQKPEHASPLSPVPAGQTVVAAGNGISLPGDGQVVEAENNISSTEGAQNGVAAAEIPSSGECQTAEAAGIY